MVAEAVHSGDSTVIEKSRDESLTKASERRWKHEPDPSGTPAEESVGSGSVDVGSSDAKLRAGASIVNEFIIGLIEHKNAIDAKTADSVTSVDLSTTELAAIKQLSDVITDTILKEMEDHLESGGPRAGQKVDHFFCVILAAVCQAYATLDDCAGKANEELARAIVGLIERDTHDPDNEPRKPLPRTIQGGTQRSPGRRKDSFAILQLEMEKDFFYQIVLKLLEAMRKTVMAPIEEGVILHLRVIGAITCPDPDRHPSVIKFCIWPLLKGPLRKMIGEELAETMESWLIETYPLEALAQPLPAAGVR